MSKILFVDDKSKTEINQLRTQEYAKASGFQLDLSTLNWKPSDDDSFVMAAKKDQTILATMRGEFIDELSILEAKLECPWNFSDDFKLPVLLLSRAATHSSQRGSGLNLLLRYWFLKFALARNIQFVVGTFVSGSPRENSLKEMGYEFYENKLGWQQSSYRSLRPVSVVALNLKTHGEHALEYCLKRLSNEMTEYEFINENFPELKFVRTL